MREIEHSTERYFVENSSSQAVCVGSCGTPNARFPGCMCSLGHRSATPLGIRNSLYQGQQDDGNRSVHGNYEARFSGRRNLMAVKRTFYVYY